MSSTTSVQMELRVASQRGDLVWVKDCLARGAKAGYKLGGGGVATALGWALSEGHDEMVEVLIKAGANPWLDAHRRHRCAWSTAIELGRVKALETMIRLTVSRRGEEDHGGARLLSLVINTLIYGNTKLSCALQSDVLKAVLPWGNVECANGWGLTPMMQAARGGSVLVATLLLDHGANVGLPGVNRVTPLMMSSKTDKGICELFLSRGADPLAVDDYGATALDWAKKRGNETAIRVLEHAELAAMTPSGKKLKRRSLRAL